MVGHRGNPARHPDNSLAGIMSGLDVAGAVEIDLRMTSDGHLLLSHDPTIEGRSIAATDSLELLATEPRPCLLDEVVGLPGRLDLEVKNVPGEDGFHPDGRLALLAASRSRPTDLVTSFYWPDMDLLRSRGVGVETGLVVGEGGSLEDALVHAAGRGHRAVAAHDSLVEADLLEKAARDDVAVMVWTVNGVDRARKLSGMGATAIISDDPSLIRNALRE